MHYGTPNSFIKASLGALGLLFLAACATGEFRAEVKRFHELGTPGGEKIEIIPAGGAEAGLEFNAYANLLAEHLTAAGYQPAPGADAVLVATLAYGARPAPGYQPASGPVIGFGIGGYGSHVGGGVSTAVDLSDPDRIYHLHSVSLVITDAKTGARVYEGSAESYAEGARMPAIMPLLLDALFQGWPGISGKRTIVKIENE